MEAWTACALCMVQGDLGVFTINHAITAAKTGGASATALVIIIMIVKVPNKWILAWLTGVIVALADILIHPTHFGDVWMEAAGTGLGAALLGLMLSGKLNKRK